jgi:hypothetical protein
MIQLKGNEIEKIINCDDPLSIKYVISDTIISLKEEGLIHDMIMCYIQELDLSLTLYKNNNLPPNQAENIKSAQEILMNKILNGIDA